MQHVLVPIDEARDWSAQPCLTHAEVAGLGPALEAAASTERLACAFSTVADAMLVLIDEQPDPRLGALARRALCWLPCESLGLDERFVRPEAGSLASEVPALLPARQRAWRAAARYVGPQLIVRLPPRRPADAIALSALAIWTATLATLGRLTPDSETRRRLAVWPQTSAGWRELLFDTDGLRDIDAAILAQLVDEARRR